MVVLEAVGGSSILVVWVGCLGWLSGGPFPWRTKTFVLLVWAAALAIAREIFRFRIDDSTSHHLLRQLRGEVLLIEWLLFDLGQRRQGALRK